MKKVLKNDAMMVQGFLLGALSVLLVDGACRAPLLAAEPGLTTLIKFCSRLPGCSQPWQGERRTLAARTLCSCIQRDSHVRKSLITSGLPCNLGPCCWHAIKLGTNCWGLSQWTWWVCARTHSKLLGCLNRLL